MAFEPKAKKVLTRPILKFAVDVPQYIKIVAPIYIGKDMKVKDGEKKKEPATLADCIDLQTGEDVLIIVNAVVKSVLGEHYPTDAYVGKCFSITKQKRKEGKQYDPFMIVEIDDPAVSIASVLSASSIGAAVAPVDIVGKAHRHNVSK